VTAREIIKELEKELYPGEDCPAFVAVMDGDRCISGPVEWIQWQMTTDQHGLSKTAQVVFFHISKFNGV
jgi:hypothetical protein